MEVFTYVCLISPHLQSRSSHLTTFVPSPTSNSVRLTTRPYSGAGTFATPKDQDVRFQVRVLTYLRILCQLRRLTISLSLFVLPCPTPGTISLSTTCTITSQMAQYEDEIQTPSTLKTVYDAAGRIVKPDMEDMDPEAQAIHAEFSTPDLKSPAGAYR